MGTGEPSGVSGLVQCDMPVRRPRGVHMGSAQKDLLEHCSWCVTGGARARRLHTPFPTAHQGGQRDHPMPFQQLTFLHHLTLHSAAQMIFPSFFKFFFHVIIEQINNVVIVSAGQWASLMPQMVKSLPAIQETWV